MRVISGTAGGLRLAAPKSPRVRPALDKVKGAVFNILYDVSGRRVLDLFAGSGSMGIEALSRGAASAVFVEEWDKAVKSIAKNLEKCRLEENSYVIKATVLAAINRLSRKSEKFDLVFVDPPYLKNLVNPTLAALAESGILIQNAIISVEHHPKEPIVDVAGLGLTDSRKYGQTCVSFLERN